MPFIPWNEASPAGSDPASTADDKIRETKIQTRERLKGLFSDWDTATDRITQEKLFVHSNGLLIRNNVDAVSLAKVFNAGGFAEFKPIHVVLTNSGTTQTGLVAPAKFIDGVTEILDPHNWHDTAISHWRVTIPANYNGIYRCSYGVSVDGGVDGASVGIGLYKNGGNAGSNIYDAYIPAINGKRTSIYWSQAISLVATDYVEPWIIGAPFAGMTFSRFLFSVELIALT